MSDDSSGRIVGEGKPQPQTHGERIADLERRMYDVETAFEAHVHPGYPRIAARRGDDEVTTNLGDAPEVMPFLARRGEDEA